MVDLKSFVEVKLKQEDDFLKESIGSICNFADEIVFINNDNPIVEYRTFYVIFEESLNKKNGFYLDIGAYDGIQTSNTFVLEKDLNWSGICVEANSEVFNTLSLNRKSKNLNLAVLDYKGYCSFYGDSVRNDNIGNLTPCDTLNNILEQNDAPSIIDYMSIDIEGSEFNALKDFDFKKW